MTHLAIGCVVYFAIFVTFAVIRCVIGIVLWMRGGETEELPLSGPNRSRSVFAVNHHGQTWIWACQPGNELECIRSIANEAAGGESELDGDSAEHLIAMCLASRSRHRHMAQAVKGGQS